MLKRYAPALDSVTRLLVYKKQLQAIAVACKPASLPGPFTFILAQNRNVKANDRKRLDSLLSHLLRIGTLYGERYGQHFPADQGMAARNLVLDDPLRMSYLTGELRALHHCWKKHGCFTKHDRYKTLLKLIAGIRGNPADPRRDISDPEELRTLKALQQLSSGEQTRLYNVPSSEYVTSS